MENTHYLENASRKLLHTAGRLAKGIGKKALRSSGSMLLQLLGQTAPFWVPLVIILTAGYLCYAQLYLGPLETMKNAISSDEDKVAAFYGTNDPVYIKSKMNVFEDYKKVAAKWADGLSPEQKSQVSIHELTWGVLAAVDRLIHDSANTGESELELKPEEVFRALAPKFTWRKSTVTVVTQACTVSSTVDEGGNVHTTYSISTNTDVSTVSLVERATTLEGTFNYSYRTDVTSVPSESPCGQLTMTTTKEILDQMSTPQDRFAPFKAFLRSKGLVIDSDIDLAFELVKVYDMKFAGNLYYTAGTIVPMPNVSGSFAEIIRDAAAKSGVPEQIIFNIMMAESSGEPFDKDGKPKRSSAGAIGLMQFMPGTAKMLGIDPTDPVQSIYGAATYLSQLFNQFKDWTLAVAAYNAGPGNVQKYNGVPPFQETIKYVKKVLG